MVKGRVGVIWDHPEVKLPRNALWLLNFVTRTLGPIAGVRGHLGSTRDQVPQEYPINGPPNFTLPGLSVTHCWGQRSCRCHLGTSKRQIAWERLIVTKLFPTFMMNCCLVMEIRQIDIINWQLRDIC